MRQTNSIEERSYPDPYSFSEIDQRLFGPVDPIESTNKRLTVALSVMTALLSIAVIGIMGLVYHFESQPVRVLSINEAGQVESFLLRLSGFTLHKSETQAALRNSLTTWAEGYFSRVRNPLNGEVATLAYPRSFIFLGNDLSEAFTQREAREHVVASFMSSGDPEYRVFVTNVVFRNLEKKPYDADIYFDRVYYSQPMTVTAKRSFLVSIQFSANPADEEIEQLRKRANLDIDSLMRINPLVVAITQIGEERAFATNPSAPQ